MAAAEFGTGTSYTVIPKWALDAAGIFSSSAREIRELLPRYAHDNLFDATRFRTRFPEMRVTTYREGLGVIRHEARK